MSLPAKKEQFPVSPVATVLNRMRQRITAIAQSLILHKRTRYFVENLNENTSKQALLQRSRAAYAWGIAWAMKFNRKHNRSLYPDRSCRRSLRPGLMGG